MPTLKISIQDKRHLQRILAQEQQVNNIFNRLIRYVSPEMRKWKDSGSSSVWVRNSGIENKIDRYLNDFHDNLEKAIIKNQNDAWYDAVSKNDIIVEQYIKDMALSSAVKNGLFARNLEGLTALQKRVDNGMNLSQRVWKITEQTKGHIELYLETGFATGRSAEAIGRDIRQLLNNPDKRFRRIRNSEGKLVLSQPMKDYHPGRGVYRSARMNAVRMASTETNMGYRMSDAERWQHLDFVLGYEVQRSRNSHPCAICDALKGKYPKEFVFPGWHPFCICFAVPIVMEHEDFADYLLHDIIPQDKIIGGIPRKAENWINNYMQKTGSIPYFIKQNSDYVKQRIPVTSNVTTPVETKSKNIIEAAYPAITNDVIRIENDIRKNTKFETGVAFDRDGKIVLDKRGAATSVSFTKEECRLTKDTVFTHNHPRGWAAKEGTLGRIGSSFSIQDITFAIGNDVAEVRAVSPTYTFSMKRPETGWGINVREAVDHYKKSESKILSKMNSMINKASPGKEVDLAIERANSTHYHLIWKDFAKKLGFEYSKVKSSK